MSTLPARVMQQLDAAIELLAVPSRWTQGCLAAKPDGYCCEPGHPEAHRWCLYGACLKVTGTVHPHGRSSALFQYLDKRTEKPLTLFNDSSTHAAVIKFLRDARAAARGTGRER